jgi:ferredoxin--NADP+ reductase
MNTILRKLELAEKTKLFIVQAEEITKKARPGQFVVVRISEYGERIPLTIADMDPVGGSITLIVQEIGYTTKKMGLLNEGEDILDLVGPLGVPTHIENFGTVVGIGGGIGIAALYPVMRGFKVAGNPPGRTISIIGCRSKNLFFWEDKMRSISDEIYITTDDGSYGEKGLVIDPLKRLIENGTVINLVFAVGPTVMMKAVADTTRPYNIKTIVSLNPIMIDATGMCGCCRVSVGGKTKFTCVDGPDFDAHQVDFELLMHRQKIYLDKEKGLL